MPSWVRRLRSRFPWLPIAVYCRCEPKAAHEIAALVRAGADTIILSGYDDLGRRLRERFAFAWLLAGSQLRNGNRI